MVEAPVEVFEGEEVEAARQAARFFRDPAQFIPRVFGDQLYGKQIEMCRSLVQNRRTSVVGANGTGKDFCNSRLIPWWLTVMRPSIVVVIGPTYRQVSDVLWNNVREAVERAKSRGFILDGKILSTPRWTIDDNWYAVGMAVGQGAGKEFTIQGYHSPHLLAVITEAHAVPDPQIAAFDRLNPERIIMTGNPFATEGRFHASFHEQRHRWHTINISAFDTPNVQAGRVVVPGMVTKEDIEERLETYGPDHPLYKAGVLCEWAGALENSLITLEWATAAVERDLCVKCSELREPEHSCAALAPAPAPVIGVDVARYGNDWTVIMRRDGPRVQVIAKLHGNDTQSVAGRVARYCLDNPARDGTLVVDETGVGGGVVDRLRETGAGTWSLVPFQDGERATDTSRYANRGAEAWYAMRELFRLKRISIPRDQKLIGQLVSRRYSVQGDARIRLQSKEELRRDGRSSPDEADALAMTFGALIRPRLRVLSTY